jgi:hypothetical protein
VLTVGIEEAELVGGEATGRRHGGGGGGGGGTGDGISGLGSGADGTEVLAITVWFCV